MARGGAAWDGRWGAGLRRGIGGAVGRGLLARIGDGVGWGGGFSAGGGELAWAAPGVRAADGDCWLGDGVLGVVGAGWESWLGDGVVGAGAAGGVRGGRVPFLALWAKSSMAWSMCCSQAKACSEVMGASGVWG